MGWEVLKSGKMTMSGTFTAGETFAHYIEIFTNNNINSYYTYRTTTRRSEISTGSGSVPTGTKVRVRVVWELEQDMGSHFQIVKSGTAYTSTLTTGVNTSTFVNVVPALAGKYTYISTAYIEKFVNTPPTAPGYITVPELKGGEPATISWASSIDTESLSAELRYYLERSVNGGTFTLIKSGSSTRTHADTPLSTWNTVQYRVRAYDGDDFGEYRTSSIVEVLQFPEFKIRVDGALKTSSDGWVRVNGVLRKIDSIWIRANGSLKEV